MGATPVRPGGSTYNQIGSGQDLRYTIEALANILFLLQQCLLTLFVVAGRAPQVCKGISRYNFPNIRIL